MPADGKVIVEALQFYNYNWEYQESYKTKICTGFEKVRQFAHDIMAQTEVLVVIGYSFPMFNRKIDKSLMGSMSPNKLKKIYIQDKDLSKIEGRIRTILPPQFNPAMMNGLTIPIIDPIKDNDQFHLPEEMDLK